MLFWLIILGSLAFAWLGLKVKFYMIWQSIFNTLISIYISTMFTPTLIGLIPEIGNSSYNYIGCLLGIAVIIFIILQTITACFLTGLSDVAFPEIFEKLGSAILGFILGFVVLSFLFFAIYIMPVSKKAFFTFFYKAQTKPIVQKTVEKTAGFIGSVSLQYHESRVQDVVQWLADARDMNDQEKKGINWDNDENWKMGPENKDSEDKKEELPF